LVSALRTWVTGLALAASILGGAAAAQETAGTRALIPVPANRPARVEVAVATDRSELRIGQTVEICFAASAEGYVTLWDIAANGEVARIFPNAFQPADAQAMRVEGAKKYCAGKNGDAFRFQVAGPTGIDDLYALWTVGPALQPKAATFATSAAFSTELQRLSAAAGDQWATAKTSFEIVPETGAVAPTLPPQAPRPQPPSVQEPLPPPAPAPRPAPPPPVAQQAPAPAPAPRPAPPPAPAPVASNEKSKLLILSMGANVKPLTKTNQDAELFAGTVSKMFGVPASDVRLIRDVRKAQFRDSMEWLRQKARPQDIVVIYFSGHGMQVKDPTGTSSDGFDEALVPYDLESPNATARDAVWAQEFANWVNKLQTNNVITVIDACHSAGLYRSLDNELLGVKTKSFVPPRSFDMSPPPEVLEAPAGQPATRAMGGTNRIGAKGILLAAARRDQYAIEASGGSVFTMVMLQDMVKAQKGTLSQVFDRTQRAVNDGTKGKQTPTSVGARDASDRLRFGP
jgi:hypothetical protein